jgi:hypothetical protein
MGASPAWRDCAPGVASWGSKDGLLGASMVTTSRGNSRKVRKAMEKEFSKPSPHAEHAGLGPAVVVGLFGPAAEARYIPPKGFGKNTTGKSVVALAVHNEYGTSKVPARPWFGPMANKFAAESAPICAALAAQLVQDGDVAAFEAGLAKLGERGVADFRMYPLELPGSGIPPPNAPAYAKRKAKIGRTKTRDLSGQTGAAIRYELEGV